MQVLIRVSDSSGLGPEQLLVMPAVPQVGDILITADMRYKVERRMWECPSNRKWLPVLIVQRWDV